MTTQDKPAVGPLSAETGCAEAPLQDLLRRVPKDAVLHWEIPEEGRELWQLGFASSPVGALMHRAADQLDAFRLAPTAPVEALGETAAGSEEVQDAASFLRKAFPRSAAGFSSAYQPTMAAVHTVLAALIQPDTRKVEAGRETVMGYCKTCNGPRAVSPCHKCGGELQPAAEGWEWPELPSIDRIRELAREVGYGVGVHGSLERDLDLIAIPWTADAVSPPELAAHIAAGLPGQVLDDVVQDKPSGRWSCNINPEGWFKMIDLSVMPTQPDTGKVEAGGVEREIPDAYNRLSRLVLGERHDRIYGAGRAGELKMSKDVGALLNAADLASLRPQPSGETRDLLSQVVNLGHNTDEPTLRQMVEHYYRSHHMPDPMTWADRYVSALLSARPRALGGRHSDGEESQ